LKPSAAPKSSRFVGLASNQLNWQKRAISSLAGMTKATVIIVATSVTEALPAQPIDPPPSPVTFGINDSPPRVVTAKGPVARHS
jgi:GTP-binding protein